MAEWRQQDSHYTVHIPGGLHKIIISPTLDTHAEHNPTRTNHDKYSSLLLPLCISFVAWKYTISLLVVIESLSPVIMTVIIAEMMTFSDEPLESRSLQFWFHGQDGFTMNEFAIKSSQAEHKNKPDNAPMPSMHS